MKKSEKRSKFKAAALTLAAIGLAAISSSANATMQVNSRGGLCVFDPAESCYWFKIGGLLQLDETIFSGKATAKRHDFPNGANIRRAWLDFKGGVGDDWSYRVTLDFRGSPVIIREAYLNFSGIEQTNIAVGQIFIPFGLENWGHKKDLMFLEQSLMTTAFLAPEFGLGVYADTHFCDMFTVAAAVYQPRQAERSFGLQSRAFAVGTIRPELDHRPRNDRTGEAIRVTFSPLHCEDTVYHFGASVKNQRLVSTTPEGLSVLTNVFQTVPEGQGRTTATLINAGAQRARRFTVGGLEAAALWGPVTVQAEYNKAKMKLHRDLTAPANFGQPEFWGWHAQAGYVITGESRCYDFCSGTFGSVIPASDCGAWEIAARYSAVNLIDDHVYGGRENNVTIGLNWFVNENVQIKFNYVRANIHPTATTIVFNRVFANDIENRVGSTAGTKPLLVADSKKRKLDIFGLRFQAAFY
jgi:phosphate-selective porin OprO/OprP